MLAMSAVIVNIRTMKITESVLFLRILAFFALKMLDIFHFLLFA